MLKSWRQIDLNLRARVAFGLGRPVLSYEATRLAVSQASKGKESLVMGGNGIPAIHAVGAGGEGLDELRTGDTPAIVLLTRRRSARLDPWAFVAAAASGQVPVSGREMRRRRSPDTTVRRLYVEARD